MITNIDTAIAEARRRYTARGQHYAVVQRADRFSVMPIGEKDAFRAAWTTKNDHREPRNMRHRCKLDASDIENIKALRASGLKLREIADKFDVSISAIDHVCAGRRWVL